MWSAPTPKASRRGNAGEDGGPYLSRRIGLPFPSQAPNEKVSNGNPHPMKTWKLERGPLDIDCADEIWNNSVPNILRIDTRPLRYSFAQNPLIYCIFTR
jgi:hypothetical protein